MFLVTNTMFILIVLSVGFQLCFASSNYRSTQPLYVQTPVCSNVPSVQNFQINKYIGRWYEIEMAPNRLEQGKCSIADIGQNYNGTQSIALTEIVNGKSVTNVGVGQFVKGPYVGELVVSFPPDPSTNQRLVLDYKIVATDYDNYIALYACEGGNIEYIWICGRRPTLDEYFLKDLKRWMQTIGINANKLVKSVRTGCPDEPRYA